MNANFVFPAQPSVPIARPPAARKQEENASRDSSALRASVLDAALELGIGSSSLVADWMFNNVVDEEDENEVCLSCVCYAFAPLFSAKKYWITSVEPPSRGQPLTVPNAGPGFADTYLVPHYFRST